MTERERAISTLLVGSSTEHYGTPSPYAELARYVLGRIDLDPASDSYWNHHVIKARTFYDERLNGLERPWFGSVIHNAPSNVKKAMRVKPWWERLGDHWARGEVDSAIWIGFQLGQLQVLQGAPVHPLQFVNLFPSDRIDFLQRMPGNAPPQPTGAPMHANYITLLPTRSSPAAARAMLGRFMERGQALDIGGAIVRPV